MINECRESRKQSLNFCVSLTAHIGDELTNIKIQWNLSQDTSYYVWVRVNRLPIMCLLNSTQKFNYK